MKCSRTSIPDPPDLGADSPGTIRSIDPASRPDLPLLGFPKIAPPPFQARESTPGPASLRRLRERDAISLRVPPSWFSTTSTVSSCPDPARILHRAADPGVHPVSPGCEPGSPWCRSCPAKLSPRRRRGAHHRMPPSLRTCVHCAHPTRPRVRCRARRCRRTRLDAPLGSPSPPG